MKQNETFKAMLADYHPDLGDGDRYVDDLGRRLEAIETVKRMYEAERRRMRSRMIVAFASGGVTGVAATIYLLLHPIAMVSPGRHLSVWLATNGNNLLTLLFITVFSVLVAVASTLAYRIFKKDYPTSTALG